MEKRVKTLEKESKLLFDLQRMNQERMDKLSEIVANNIVNNLKDMKSEINRLRDKLK